MFTATIAKAQVQTQAQAKAKAEEARARAARFMFPAETVFQLFVQPDLVSGSECFSVGVPICFALATSDLVKAFEEKLLGHCSKVRDGFKVIVRC